MAWTDQPSPTFERSFAQYHWLSRGIWRPGAWDLNLAAFLDRRPIGSQSLHGKEFAVLREVGTGSWITRSEQGKGYGKELRLAVLALAFDGLGAEVATSAAFLDNAQSGGVSRALGYEPDGHLRQAPRGVARELRRYRMTRQMWRSRERPPVEIVGLDGCLELFGVGPQTGR